MNMSIVEKVWLMCKVTGHFSKYTAYDMLQVSLGEIGVQMSHGFHGSDESRQEILQCIERCRKLLGCKKPLNAEGQERVLRHFMLALSDKVLDCHYLLGGTRRTAEGSDRYFQWNTEHRITVAKMAVARYFL